MLCCADFLFAVEGCGQGPVLGVTWGDGFVTNATLIKSTGISDANVFFKTLMTKSYRCGVGSMLRTEMSLQCFATSRSLMDV